MSPSRALTPSQTSAQANAGSGWQERYRAVLAATTDGVVVQRADGAIVDANPRAEQILGQSLDQLTGVTSQDFTPRCIHEDGSTFPGEQHPGMVSLATGRPLFDVPMGVFQPDGSLRWITINTQPLQADDTGMSTGVVATFKDVTEQRHAEAEVQRHVERLQVSEHRLREAQRLARVGSWEWDAREDRVTWSDQMVEMIGLAQPPPSEINLRDALLFVVAEADRPAVAEKISMAIADPVNHGSYQIEFRVALPEATARWLEARAEPVLDDSGTAVGLRGTVQDITQRRETEAERDRTEALLSAVMDHSPSVIYVLDAEGRFVTANRSFSELVGRDLADIRGRTNHEVFPPDVADAYVTVNRKLLAEGGSITVEEVAPQPDGDHLYLSQKFVMPDLAGVGRVICGVSTDITASRRAEDAIGEAREFLRAITDHMAEGLIAEDEHGHVTYMNPHAEELLGHTLADIAGQIGHEVFHFADADGNPRLPESCLITRARREGVPQHVDDDVFIRRDGQLLPVSYTASPIKNGRLHGTVIVFRDITEQKAEQERVTAELELLSWVGRVRDALDRDRFVLLAQPIVDVESGEIIQHELLIRMRGEDGELIAPGSFLPAAERFGLISEIDLWVAGQAVALAAGGLPVEFNVSGASVVRPEVIDRIEQELSEHDVAPGSLICEITETALVEDEDTAATFVTRLRDLGVDVALDDFGTGYGGLSFVKHLPVSYLKIDVDFVRDLLDNEPSRHVVAAVVSLAKGFDKKTVAEGVEDPQVMGLLKELGVDHAQGYALGRPAPIEECRALYLAQKEKS